MSNLNNKTKLKILNTNIKLQELYNLNRNELIALNFTQNEIDTILNPKTRNEISGYLDYINKNNIHVINIKQNDYPNKLRYIYNPPIVLYVKGNISILNNTSIAIIGSRQCSDYGINIARRLAYSLAKKNINIISGLAYGIDTQAHIGTLKAKGKTIAVTASGLDIVYPKVNSNLEKEIINNNGAIVSEYCIGTKPEPKNFPARNRIISGLSDGVVVVEAQKRSGTSITVNFALDQGKEVYAVPGNITSINSYGTNELIKQGAKVVTCAGDILEDIIN